MTIDIFSLIIGAILWELVSTYFNYKIKAAHTKHKAQKQTKKSKNDSNNNSKEEES